MELPPDHHVLQHRQALAAHDAVLLSFVEAFEFAHRVIDDFAGLCACGFAFIFWLCCFVLRRGCLRGFSCWLLGGAGISCGACGCLRGFRSLLGVWACSRRACFLWWGAICWLRLCLLGDFGAAFRTEQCAFFNFLSAFWTKHKDSFRGGIAGRVLPRHDSEAHQ